MQFLRDLFSINVLHRCRYWSNSHVNDLTCHFFFLNLLISSASSCRRETEMAAAWHLRSQALRKALSTANFWVMLIGVGCWDLKGSKGIFLNCTWAQKKAHKIIPLCLWVPPINSLPNPNTWEGSRIESQRRSWPWRTNESIPKFWIHQQIIKAKGVRNLLCILFLYDFREKVKQSSSIHLANIPHQCFRKSTQPRNLLLSKGLGGDEGKDGKRKRDQANSKKINIFFVSTYKQWFFQFLILSSVFSSENCIYFLYLCLAPVNIMTMHNNKAQLFPFFTLPASLNHPR